MVINPSLLGYDTSSLRVYRRFGKIVVALC